MRIILISICALIAVYCVLCIGFREIRKVSWKGTSNSLGTVTYIGISVFMWSFLLAVIGAISIEHRFLLVSLIVVAAILVMVGYFFDIS